MKRLSRHFVPILFISGALVTCGPIENRFSKKDDKEDSDSTSVKEREVPTDQEPEWAKNVALSCAWGSVLTSIVAEISCQLKDGENEFVAQDTVAVTVEAVGKSGDLWDNATVIVQLVTEKTYKFKFPLAENSQKKVQAKFKDNEIVFYRDFDLDNLPGMDPKLGLFACARGGNHIKDCFDRAKIALTATESGQSPGPPKSFCEDTDVIDNPLCEFSFDAIVGGN